jgi:hypothetical protein
MSETVPAYSGKGKATIIPQGQTSGPTGNDPFVQMKIAAGNKTVLKP